MKRYFFDVKRDLELERDGEGAQLPTLEHVRRYALRVLVEAIMEDAMRLDGVQSQVFVRDEADDEVLALRLAFDQSFP